MGSQHSGFFVWRFKNTVAPLYGVMFSTWNKKQSNPTCFNKVFMVCRLWAVLWVRLPKKKIRSAVESAVELSVKMDLVIRNNKIR